MNPVIPHQFVVAQFIAPGNHVNAGGTRIGASSRAQSIAQLPTMEDGPIILSKIMIGASSKCSGLVADVYGRGNGSALPGNPHHLASPSFPSFLDAPMIRSVQEFLRCLFVNLASIALTFFRHAIAEIYYTWNESK
jgi:hypothetical protein